MGKLSDRINNLSESATIAMSQLSREIKAKGNDVISLSLGEPDFDTPEFIKDAAKKALDDGYTTYSPVPGYPELREAIVTKLKRDNDLTYSAAQIVVSTGAKQSLANVMLCMLNSGDEALIPAPYWVSYVEQVKLAEGVPVEVSTTIDTDFKVTPAQLEAAITPKTKLIIFSSPCNPSGSVYTKAELKAIAEVVAKHPNVYIVADEIYEYINFADGHQSIAQFDFIYDQVITINGFAKGYAMTGWRLGYIAAPLWIAKACDKLQGQTTSGPCSFAQIAAITALKADPKSFMTDMVEAFRRRRDMMVAKLKEIPGLKVNLPDGAFYIFPDVSAYFGKSYNGKVLKDGNDICLYILNEVFVACVPGDSFGSPECIRISYAAADDVLVDAAKRISSALSKLA
jgi:aspartate aminotransferase